MHKLKQSYSNDTDWVTSTGEIVSQTYDITLDNSNNEYYPYMDTFRRYDVSNGILHNDDEQDREYEGQYILEDTGGGYSNQECDTCGGAHEMECPDCDGSGKNEDDSECSGCSGTGTHTCENCGGEDIECGECRGEGRIECDDCEGNGSVPCPDCQ